jgi:hypothetical protein
MYVYWPEKYRSHFLHVLSFFLKVWVSVVSFDDFFSFTYQSHNLWSWPLERVWYQHTLLSQRSPTLPYIFCFIRKGIMEPSLLCVFLLPPGFFFGMRLCERIFGYLQGVFLWEFLEFQSYSKHKDHFNVSLKQICSKNNSSDSFGQVWKSLFCCFGKSVKWCFIGQNGSSFNLRVLENQSSKHSFYLYE